MPRSPRVSKGGIRTKGRSYVPRKRPIQQRSKATVEFILEGGAQVFEEHGYRQTTTDQIAHRAGVSIGTLYQYYPDKDAILVSLFEKHLHDISIAFSNITHRIQQREPLEHIIEQLSQKMFSLHVKFPRLHKILIEEAPIPVRLFEQYRKLEESLRSELVIYCGESISNPESVVLTIFHTLELFAHRYTIYPPSDCEPEKLWRSVVDMVLAYIRVEQSRDLVGY